MTTQAATRTYTIDGAHSTAEFSVKHMMISSVKGVFRDVVGHLQIDETAPERSSVEATIAIASVDTGVQMRDDDLRSANFFDAERFPVMTFRSRGVEQVDEETWKVRGDLTIRDVTLPVILETAFGGRIAGFDGAERLGFTAETTINRKDFGLNYNAVLETGGVVVGDRVKVSLHIEAVEA